MGESGVDKRLSDLYDLPNYYGEQNIYLLELREECGRLEYQLLDAAEDLPQHLKTLIEGYIATRDELEFQSVKVALRFGKRQGSG